MSAPGEVNGDRADAGREAASRVERGVQLYAEGRYPEAVAEFEAALQLTPGNAQAIECLAWVKDLVAGRRKPLSGSFTTIAVPAESAPAALEPVPPPPLPQPGAGPTGRTMLGMPVFDPASGKPGGQLEDGPESVTREWHSVLETQNLPQLDVPELSEEQIASLLEVGHTRGLTLTKGAEPVPAVDLPPPITPLMPAMSPFDEAGDEMDDDEHDQTHVRLQGRVIELVAEEPTLPPGSTPKGILPALEPLASPASADQTADDPMSQPTSPFLSQRLHELAPTIAHAQEASIDELPSAPKTPPADAWQPVRAALERGEVKAAFDGAEQVLKRSGVEAVDSGQPELLQRIYETLVGDLTGVPRFGKATPDLDSRSAFLLSRMDGTVNADDLIDISGMKRLDALRILAQLVAAGVVVLRR